MLLNIRNIFDSFESNFIYKLADQSDKAMSSNNLLSFSHVENSIFSNNLVLIDSSLCLILAQLVRLKHLNYASEVSKLLMYLSSINPLNIESKEINLLYQRKLKDFLSAIAFGMNKNQVWTGLRNSNEHSWKFIDREYILPHHILKKNDFENYLLNNTKLETPSSTRHGFGVVYEENGFQFIKLNLQIRFIR